MVDCKINLMCNAWQASNSDAYFAVTVREHYVLSLKRIEKEGRERRRLRSNCREAHRDRDNGMSRT